MATVYEQDDAIILAVSSNEQKLQQLNSITLEVPGNQTVQIPENAAIEEYMPHRLKRCGNAVKWISTVGPSFNCKDYKPNDAHALKLHFEQLLETSRALLTLKTFEQLADQYEIHSGKWVLYVDDDQVDDVWRLVANEIQNNEFGGFSTYARVSTVKIPQHAICIYSKTSDTNEIEGLEKAIRKIGIKRVLYYKPDIYTFCGIHGNHDCRIRPIIFTSEYNKVEDKGSILPTNFNAMSFVRVDAVSNYE
uniref:Uncharacterized protein n=1 Tax=Strigamia maritima TaxID=126957 RepID=T1J0L5_STRMM